MPEPRASLSSAAARYEAPLHLYRGANSANTLWTAWRAFVVTLLAVGLLILVSFVAGIVARTGLGSRISGWFANSFLGNLPQYQVVRSMAEGLSEVSGKNSNLKPVLVSIADGWQIGYLLEPLENGWLAIFLPKAPTPTSGDVKYLPADRVRPLNLTMLQAKEIVKHIGIGSGEALRGVDLSPPGATVLAAARKKIEIL